MTTEPDDRRIDLTVLGPENPAQADEVIRAAMSRIRASASRREPWLAELGAWWRPGLAAAAAIALLAIGLVLASGRSSQTPAPASVEARVLDWAESGQVPTNGELLTAFREYSP